jgi:glutamyl-tRNA synthetase
MVLPLLPAESMPTQLTMVRQGLDLLRQRSHTLHEIAEGAQIFYHRYAELDEKSQQILKNTDPFIIQILQDSLKNLGAFTAIYLKEFYTEWANSNALKLPTVMQLLRALLLGTFAAPGIFEVMEILGPEECLNRIGGIK